MLGLCGNVFFEGVETNFPEFPVVFEPGIGLAQRKRAQAADVLSAVNFALDEAGALEHHDMLGNCVEGNGEGPGNFADGGRPAGKHLQHGPTGRVSDSGEDASQTIGAGLSSGIFNH